MRSHKARGHSSELKKAQGSTSAQLSFIASDFLWRVCVWVAVFALGSLGRVCARHLVGPRAGYDGSLHPVGMHVSALVSRTQATVNARSRAASPPSVQRRPRECLLPTSILMGCTDGMQPTTRPTTVDTSNSHTDRPRTFARVPVSGVAPVVHSGADAGMEGACACVHVGV